MKRITKCFLVVLLSIVMLSAFGLASCKTTAPAEVTEAEVTEAEATEAEVTEAEATDTDVEVTTVDWPSWQWEEPGGGDFLMAVKEHVEKNYPIKINNYQVSNSDYFSLMETAMAGGAAPGILIMDADYLAKWGKLGMLEPLNKFEGFNEVVSNFTSVQGEYPFVQNDNTYGLVKASVAMGMWYNKTLLKDAGISNPPTTPDEFYEAAKKMTNAPETFGYGAAYKSGNKIMKFMAAYGWVRSFHGDFFVDGKPTANDPNTIKGIEFFKKLYDEGLSPKDADGDTYRPMFWNGKIGLLLDGSWMVGMIEGANEAILPEIGSAMFPNAGNYGLAWPNAWAIPAGAPDKEASWIILKTLESEQFQKSQVELTGQYSANLNFMPEDYIEKHPLAKPFIDVLSSPDSVSINFPKLEDQSPILQQIINEYLDKVLFEGKPVGATMEELQKALENEISKN